MTPSDGLAVRKRDGFMIMKVVGEVHASMFGVRLQISRFQVRAAITEHLMDTLACHVQAPPSVAAIA